MFNLINHTMNADGLVLISPSSASLCQLVHECEKCGMNHTTRRRVFFIIFIFATLTGCFIPAFKLKWFTLRVIATCRYLGNYSANDLSDDDNINRQRRTLYVQRHMILRKFSMRSLKVKLDSSVSDIHLLA